MMFRNRGSGNNDAPPPPNTLIGSGSSFRGTLMVSGTLRIDGEFEGDILNCERLEVGEHGLMRSDVEVKEALIQGRVIGNVRALGVLEMKSGAKVEGDVAAISVAMEPGVYFTGRCTMLDTGSEGVEMGLAHGRSR
jgi:cytoskeletal protein CcmA (bactofilin family)